MNYELLFKENLKKFKNDVDFQTEELILEFTEKIVERMGQLNLSRVELAKKLGVSKAFITKLLNGNPNLTIKTMVSIARVLDCKLEIDLCPTGFESRKFYIPKNKEIVYSDFKKVLENIINEEFNASAA